MKKLFLLLSLISLIFTYSCKNDDPSYDELKKEVEELKSLLDQDISIDEVSFEGSDIILKFANGQTLRSTAPTSIIPQIGKDGCWCVNGESLGIKATPEQPEIPTVKDGYWYIGDTNTNVKATGDTGAAGQNGADGKDGANGKGIAKIDYQKTTGILIITLTDGSKTELLLFTEEMELKARKLGDLDGKYLIESIWGGDMKFMDIEYDDQNRITKINSYKNVFNQPVKYASVFREYDGDKISKATFEMYAEVDKTITGRKTINCITNKPVFFNKTDNYFQDPEDTRYIYLLINKASGGGFYVKVAKRAEDKKMVITKEDDDLFVWTEQGSINIESQNKTAGPETIYYCHKKFPVLTESDTVKYEDGGKTINSYESIYNFENPNNVEIPQGEEYFYLRRQKYTRDYNKGDVIMAYSLHYAYNGSDPLVYLPLDNRAGEPDFSHENRYNLSIVMDGNKLDKIYFPFGGTPQEMIKFHYHAGLLSHLSSPVAKVDSIAEFLYDEQNNPIAMNVDSKRLRDTICGNDGSEFIDNILGMLGLNYTYYEENDDDEDDDYEAKHIYTKGFVPLIKMNYDYKMKNFLGHTFKALCPIWEGFSQTNAMEEILWAGHASGMTAEYRKFNAGGYPTEIKGYLRIGVSDVANIYGSINPDDSGEILNYLPNIGNQIEPIATSIQLKYKKIEEPAENN